jgi:hypothetical protein
MLTCKEDVRWTGEEIPTCNTPTEGFKGLFKRFYFDGKGKGRMCIDRRFKSVFHSRDGYVYFIITK